jgi:hypothetical protein
MWKKQVGKSLYSIMKYIRQSLIKISRGKNHSNTRGTKNAVFCGVMPWALVRPDVSEERLASIIRVEQGGKVSPQCALITANVVPSSLILSILIM